MAMDALATSIAKRIGSHKIDSFVLSNRLI